MIYLENDLLEVEISETGAEVQRIFQKSEKIDYLWDGDPQYWSGHAPVLFPIVGRLNENSYLHKGKQFELPQHGFARRMEWRLEEAAQEQAVFVLSSNLETKKKYPFDFDLRAIYTLNENILQINYEVENRSEEIMPYSLGSHPAFRVPLNGEGEFDDYQVTFHPALPLQHFEIEPAPYLQGSQKPFEQLENGILKVKREWFQGSLLINTENKIETVTLTSPVEKHGVRLQVSEFPYLCFWTKEDTEAPFLCMEPFHGLPDVFGKVGELLEKKGIIPLEPGKKKKHTYTIEIF